MHRQCRLAVTFYWFAGSDNNEEKKILNSVMYLLNNQNFRGTCILDSVDGTHQFYNVNKILFSETLMRKCLFAYNKISVQAE